MPYTNEQEFGEMTLSDYDSNEDYDYDCDYNHDYDCDWDYDNCSIDGLRAPVRPSVLPAGKVAEALPAQRGRRAGSLA